MIFQTSQSSGTETLDQICNTFGMQTGASLSSFTQQDIQEMANKKLERYMQRMANSTIQRRKNMDELNSLRRPRVTPVTPVEGTQVYSKNIISFKNIELNVSSPNFRMMHHRAQQEHNRKEIIQLLKIFYTRSIYLALKQTQISLCNQYRHNQLSQPLHRAKNPS